ncbi:hypothetical protein [Streptomyces erythrochromogenes]|uniref:hypothetical protein n=1 Tax=Streptomyces erythrochromogenes TaxID=285574 RepID=UPI0036FF1433
MTYIYAKTKAFDRTTVDKNTGEIRQERVTESENSRHRIDFGGSYGTISDAAWELMDDVLMFTNNDKKLLGALIRRRSKTEHGLVRIGPKNKFAKDIGMSIRALHRSFAVLEGAGFIWPLCAETWMLSARWMFNGGGEAHQQALRKIPHWVPDLFHRTSYGKKQTVSSWADLPAAERRPRAA